MSYSFEIGSFSDIGKVRKINEDYSGSFYGSYGRLLIVCDGMGGHQGGEIASRLAVDTISNHFEHIREEFDPQNELHAAIQKANGVIIEAGNVKHELSDMGSTVVMALIKDDYAFTANVGDSRIYFIRDNSITQITTDHSLVQQMVDSDLISPEEAKDHPKKNIITNALGIEDDVEPEIIEPFKLTANDCLVLCTDGLTNFVRDEEILHHCFSNPPQDAAELLVDLANERGGTDNITVQILKVHKVNSLEQGNGTSKLIYVTLFAIVIAVAIYALFTLNIFNSDNYQTTVGKTKNTESKSEVTNTDNIEPAALLGSSTVQNPDSAKSNSTKSTEEKTNNENNHK